MPLLQTKIGIRNVVWGISLLLHLVLLRNRCVCHDISIILDVSGILLFLLTLTIVLLLCIHADQDVMGKYDTTILNAAWGAVVKFRTQKSFLTVPNSSILIVLKKVPFMGFVCVCVPVNHYKMGLQHSFYTRIYNFFFVSSHIFASGTQSAFKPSMSWELESWSEQLSVYLFPKPWVELRKKIAFSHNCILNTRFFPGWR